MNASAGGSKGKGHWTTAGESTAYQEVRSALENLGHEAECWDSLAFSIGMLPNLSTHGPALATAAELLHNPVFDRAADWSGSDWAQWVPRWRQMLASWPTVRATRIGQHNTLEPASRSLGMLRKWRNPLEGRGIEVGPLISALLATPRFAASGDASCEALNRRFDHLRAMMMAAYMHCKWASNLTTQDYLEWRPDGRHEFSPRPIESDKACLAIRWLAEPSQADMVEVLPDATDPRTFVAKLESWTRRVTPRPRELDAPTAENDEERRRRHYPRALEAYFLHWGGVLGRVAPRARGPSLGLPHTPGGLPPGAIEKAPRPGARTVPGSPKGSPRTPGPSGAGSLDDPPGGGNGIAPGDIEVPGLPLVPVAKALWASSRRKWRSMYAAMADTITCADLRYLSRAEAAQLVLLTARDASAVTVDSTLNAELIENALLTLLTLSLGLAPDQLVQTRLLFWPRAEPLTPSTSSASKPGKYDGELRQVLNLPIEAPVLLIWGSHPQDTTEPGGSTATASGDLMAYVLSGVDPMPAWMEPVAFLIPAVTPRLSSEESFVTAEDSTTPRQTVRNLLLPAGRTGQLLLDYWLRQRQWRRVARTPEPPAGHRDDAHIFRTIAWSAAPPATGQRQEPTGSDAGLRIKHYLDNHPDCPKPIGHESWSVALLQGHMAAAVEATSGDRTLAWLVTCQTHQAGQARLYYTQHSLKRLADSWITGSNLAGLSSLMPDRTRYNPASADRPIGSSPGLGPAEHAHLPDAATVACLPVTWPWTSHAMSALRVGAPFVAPVKEIKKLIRLLQAQLSAPVALDRRSALRAHHASLLMLTLVYQGLFTGLRAVRSPVALIRAVEQADRVHDAAGLPLSEDVMVGLADKESYYNQRARLVRLQPLLIQQLRILQAHQLALVERLDLVEPWRAAPARTRAMFCLDENDNLTEVTVAWVEQQLAALGFPWPANFARGFLRTELLTRGCPAADLDALLGHRDAGGGSIGLHSTHDARASHDRLYTVLAKVHAELGIKVVPSAIAPHPGKRTDKDVLLAPMHAAGPVGRGRSGRHRQQGKISGLPTLWQTVHQRATDDDRAQVVLLLRLLSRLAARGNALAQMLCADDPRAPAVAGGPANTAQQPVQTSPSTNGGNAEGPFRLQPVHEAELAASADDLVASLKHLAERTTRARFHLAASWFRLLQHARNVLHQWNIRCPDLPLVDVLRPPTSPFVESSVLVLPIVDGWRHAVHLWAVQALAEARRWRSAPASGPSDKGSGQPADTAEAPSRQAAIRLPDAPSVFAAEGWAAALVISAVVHGMLLDVAQLSMLLRRFSAPGPRDLPLSGPESRAHLDFRVPASGSMDRQTHRWWFDPTTELIWLSAPAMPTELRLGDIYPWLRRIALQAFPGSVRMPFEPRSFSDLVRCSEVWWLARASRTAVASQRRQIDASSVLSERWGRLVGAKRLVAPTVPYLEELALQAAADEPAPKRARRRGPKTALPSDFEVLALVDFDQDRSVEPTVDAVDPAAADVELLASLAAALPWVQQTADALQAAASSPSTLDIDAMRALLPEDHGLVSVALIDFAQWLAAPDKGAFTGPPLARSFTAAAQALLLSIGDAPETPAPDAETFARIIRESDDLPVRAGASVRSVRQAILRMAQSRGLRDQVLALIDDEDREDLKDPEDEGSHADACILSHEEFAQAMQALEKGLYAGITQGDRALGQLLLTLCFRLGLRPGEVYGLRLRDVTPTDLYVLPYEAHILKSGNARRRVPLDVLMPADELRRLSRFVRHRLRRGAVPDDLLLAQPTAGSANRQRLDRWVHRVLRSVTMDARVRLYHARHSLSTWCDLALRSLEHPQVLRFFAHMPLTSAFLRQGEALSTGLFGCKEAALGKSSFGLARLVGHVGPAITHMHYIHGDDLVRSTVVEREAGTASREAWANLLGVSMRQISACLAGGRGFARLMDHARKQAGWRTNPVSLVSGHKALRVEHDTPSPTGHDGELGTPVLPDLALPGSVTSAGSTAGAEDWIAFSKLVDLSSAIAKGQRTPGQMAAMFGLNEQRVETVMDGLRHWLPQVAQPGDRASREAQSGQVGLTLTTETSTIMTRAEAWMCARAGHDPTGLTSDLDFLIGCYDRRDRDFHVREAQSLHRLTTLLVGMGVKPSAAQVVVRALHPEKAAPPPFATTQALGPFGACTLRPIGVRVAAKAASYAKWVGIMPVTRSGESCASVFALAAALGRVLLHGS